MKGKVLIVDDTPANLGVVVSMLNDIGVEISVAEGGVSALEQVQLFKPDLILLDVIMPGIDGFETCHRLKKGNETKEIPVIFMSALDDTVDKVKGFELGAVDYITKPFQEAELLARVKTHLDLSQTVEALREAKEVAEEATKLKDKFVSLVAHDLKSPLSSLLGFLNLVSEDKATPLNPNHLTMIGSAQKIGNNLINMIEELLKISRLQTGKLSLKKRFFDVNFSTLTAFANLSHLAEKKGIIIKSEIPPETIIYGDKDLFDEVIQNLVSNAIKFCRKGDVVTVFVPKESEVAIAVKDTGIGISEERLPSIFKHEETTSTHGTAGEMGSGLGLPFCKDIMQAHKGTLTVESVEGNGSLFTASLPLVRPLVLLIEDDDASRTTVRECLEKTGMNVLEAVDGNTACNVLEKNNPHLILLDLILPGMGAFQFLKHIKSQEAIKNIPVIVITDDKKMETREKAFQLGASDYISKPVIKEDLIPRARKFMR